ncbi:MAG: hypothetical protein ACD_71C00214G0001, partial [uncultured bacterium (gcode 4)]
MLLRGTKQSKFKIATLRSRWQISDIKLLKHKWNASVWRMQFKGVILTTLCVMPVKTMTKNNGWHLLSTFYMSWLLLPYTYKLFSNLLLYSIENFMRISGKKLVILSLTLISTCAVALGGTYALGFFQDWTWTNAAQTQTSLVQTLRMQAIQQLIDNKFTHFATMPFGPGNDNMHITGSMTYPDYPDYVVKTNIFLQDDLDVLLAKKMKEQPVARSF